MFVVKSNIDLMSGISTELLNSNVDYEVSFTQDGVTVELMNLVSGESFAVIKRKDMESCFAGLMGLLAKTVMLSKLGSYNNLEC